MFRPRARALLLLCAYLLLTTITRPGPAPRLGAPAALPLSAVPVVLDSGDPGRRRVGSLIFRRGWDLNADDRRFGGLSAMQIEGNLVTAISDDGYVMTFPLPGSGPRQVRILPLRDGPGDRDSKFNRDTEAMAIAGPHAWIGYERHNMVWRYRRADWRAESSAQPPAMRRWPRNSGTEAMVRLADGRFILFSEGSGGSDSAVALFDGDPSQPGTSAIVMRYRRLPGYRVTDAALLPDGRLMILNRRFGWGEGFSAIVAVADIAGLGADAVIVPRAVARLEPPLTVDNMEALSVAREGGRTIVRIASDDNFLRLQRTLLLEFELLGDRN
jgi:hypothetical protein